jgi:CheY-like chemotaxis protein
MGTMERRKRLLVVDDEPAILEILSEYFESRYDVATASNPARGLLIASQRSFDVILLDINMPGMTGLELATAILNQGSTAAILFMTGYPSRRLISEARRLGAVACLEKPTDLLELDELIGSSAHRETFTR